MSHTLPWEVITLNCALEKFHCISMNAIMEHDCLVEYGFFSPVSSSNAKNFLGVRLFASPLGRIATNNPSYWLRHDLLVASTMIYMSRILPRRFVQALTGMQYLTAIFSPAMAGSIRPLVNRVTERNRTKRNVAQWVGRGVREQRTSFTTNKVKKTRVYSQAQDNVTQHGAMRGWRRTRPINDIM